MAAPPRRVPRARGLAGLAALSEVYRRLLAFESRAIRLGTERIEAILARLDHPERAPPRTIIIAGTNGKGSVAATLSASAKAAGLLAGLYTSPHLVRVHERFRVADEDIDAASFERLGGRVLDTMAGIPLTVFEALTAIGFLWFAERRVDLAILEVGLGGATDATNVALVTHSVVTGVGRDHTEILGATLTGIARVKLGVCRPGAPAVLVLPRAARHLAPPGWLHGRDFGWRRTLEGIRVRGPFGVWDLPAPALPGRHQCQNAAVAAAAGATLGLTRDQVAEGMRTVRWRARLERLPGEPPAFIDGAHNPDGVAALVAALPAVGLEPGFTLVFGAHPKKDAPAMLRTLAARAGEVFLTTAPLLQSPEVLAAYLAGREGVRVEADPGRALALARSLGRPVLVAGSLYLAGAVLASLE